MLWENIQVGRRKDEQARAKRHEISQSWNDNQ